MEGSYQVRVARDDELAKLGDIEDRAGQLFAGTAHSYVCAAPPLSLEILWAQQRIGAVWVAVASGGEPV